MTAQRQRQHLVTTPPRRSICASCKRVVVDGITDGLAYRIDPAPLNLLGEVTARVAGRNTYRLIAGRPYIREHNDIEGDTRRGRPPVAATHTCTPIDPSHLDPAHVKAFTPLIREPTPEATEDQNQEQNSLFVITGVFAGARVIAVPADDPPPF